MHMIYFDEVKLCFVFDTIVLVEVSHAPRYKSIFRRQVCSVQTNAKYTAQNVMNQHKVNLQQSDKSDHSIIIPHGDVSDTMLKLTVRETRMDGLMGRDILKYWI